MQWISIFGAIGLFMLLYFGLDSKPKNIEALEKTRTLSAEKTSAGVLIKLAKESLEPSDVSSLELMEQEFVVAVGDSSKSAIGKRLSGRWYELKKPAIAGHFAMQVAELENSEDAWSIAGTTFALCLKRSKDDAEKDFCTKRAIQSFENAISLNPSENAHKLNLALVYVDNPPEDQPMKGIQILLGMNRENPENVTVIKALARLGIQTGQMDKALDRLIKAKGLAPDDKEIDCLLVKVYEANQQNELALKAAQKCNS